MGTFSYTMNKPLSLGNRRGYIFDLTNVQTTGSVLHTPFKKVTGYLIETSSPGTSQITVSSNDDATGMVS